MKKHAELAKEMGIGAKNIFVSDVGRVFEITPKGARLGATVPSGKILVDGLGVGDVGNVVLRDRRHLSQDGLITVVVTLNANTRKIMAGPDIVSRGFIYTREAGDLMDELKKTATDVITSYSKKKRMDWAGMKNTMRSKMSDYLYRETKRSPMIMPIIMEV